MSSLRDYLKLTKPTIVLLVLITGATGLVMEGSLVSQPIPFLIVMVALFATAGCANALNQYFEREIDAQMPRTAKKRPLPSGRLKPGQALAFAVGIGILGVALFAIFFNWLSAALALATILFYGLFYTLYLKPRTHLNIVIGGAAGAMGPVIAWAAATDGLHLTPWLLFLVIFFWTPPHFWALAYCLKEEYTKVQYPMLPNVKGDTETLRQIFIYTVLMIGITLLLWFSGVGLLYIGAAIVLGGFFLWKAVRVMRRRERREAWGLFGYSIVYLLLLFVVMMVDAAWTVRPWMNQ
ncbi:heme o synthase [bacterium]|nr:heme o synthase [bacterium]